MSKCRLEMQHDGAVARVVLAAPKANILDDEMNVQLSTIFDSLEKKRDLHAIVISADGPNFSFGASVEEHLPDRIDGALARLGGLLRRIVSSPAPTIAAVRGHCLGGGFELVLACDMIIAEETAQFGLPEIRLGVFPPAGAALLPVRLGTAAATSLVLTGASWNGAHAARQGLVARMAPEGNLEPCVDAFLDEMLIPRSAAALRHAARAVRTPVMRALLEELPRLERLYLDDLMKESDAIEGIRAFLEKREPRWARPQVLV